MVPSLQIWHGFSQAKCQMVASRLVELPEHGQDTLARSSGCWPAATSGCSLPEPEPQSTFTRMLAESKANRFCALLRSYWEGVGFATKRIVVANGKVICPMALIGSHAATEAHVFGVAAALFLCHSIDADCHCHNGSYHQPFGAMTIC